MICSVAYTCFGLLESAAGSDIRLDTEDRLYMCCYCFCIKLDGPEHIAVVRNRHRVHTEFFTAFEQFIKWPHPAMNTDCADEDV